MTIPISDTLVPGGSGYGIVKDSDQIGGWAVETSESTIGALSSARLRVGMQRYSLSSAITYQLTSLTPAGGFANGTWTPAAVPSSGGQWSPGVATVATANLSLTGEQTINGVTTSTSRVLVVGQSSAATNGLYVTSLTTWARTSDANSAGAFVAGKSVPVLGGTFAGTIYVCNTVPTTLGTDPIAFIANTTGSVVSLLGDVTGTTAASVVSKLNGVAVSGTPSSGQIIIASSGTAAAWQAAPTGFVAGTDLSGTSTNQTVIQIHGTTVPAGGSLTTGNGLHVSGASAVTYSALNLAGGSGYVSGQLPVANLANGTAGQTLVTNSGATAPAWITVSGDTTLTAAGVAAVVSITGPSGGGGTVPMTFLEADWSPVSSMTVKTLAASVQTTNATLTTIATIATATGKTYAVQAQLSTQLSGGDWLANSYTCYFENNAGTTTIRGNVIGTAGGTTNGLAWPGLSFALSGTSVVAQVTGAASTTITWKVALTVQVSG